jgi:hypothetical protein
LKEFLSTITAEKPTQQTHQIKKLKNFRPKNGQRASNNGKHPSQRICRGKLEHTSLKKNKRKKERKEIVINTNNNQQYNKP